MSSMGLVRLKIRELAKERGWTLKEVSNRSGVNYSTIKTYAASAGMAMADISAVIRLTRVFEVSIEDLVEVIEE
ncbi:helix-turn-helix domain-containing protein [Leptolyngbya sp. NIES-2104]|uniref:helix-turn-helix domain-containing protein n=1 Tax=Leptolyngbya sp. NIES-2104 TaxID=1552121 RepID=UPI0006ECB8D5|nr:helix-turn-helix transcriptional regulator [Leptolyngbya sp. NIES-2104]GAP99390.1 putative transcriptional regulator [Leptolyngbya sp. NIES-2104]